MLNKKFILINKFTQNENYNNYNSQLSNINKKWKETAVAYNNPYPADIPRSSNNEEKFPEYILEIFEEKNLKNILNRFVNKNIKINLHKYNLSWNNKFKINKNTWYNRINDFNTYDELNNEDNQQIFTTLQSCLPNINKILNFFINKFNNNYFHIFIKRHNKYYKKFNPFSIYKFKLHKINQKFINNKCIYEYGIFIVLVKDGGYVGPNIYLNFITINNIIYLTDYDLIGYYTTDKLYLPEGNRTIGKKDLYELDPLYRNNKQDRTINAYLTDDNWPYLNVNYYNVDKILWKQKQYQYDNILKNQYTCFNKEPEYYNPSGITTNLPNSYSQPILKYIYNKNNCEAKYDHYGRRKPIGYWDKPCRNNKECLFYKKNKNYPNKFGGCDKSYGFCELPKGMKNLGYHSYYNINVYKPLCYNCKSVNKTNKWKAQTLLDDCCEEQKDKTKYPHLISPDYAFHNDISARIHHSTNIKKSN